jgi:hypothetical protein
MACEVRPAGCQRISLRRTQQAAQTVQRRLSYGGRLLLSGCCCVTCGVLGRKRTLDAHACRLRPQLEQAGARATSSIGAEFGYRLVDHAPEMANGEPDADRRPAMGALVELVGRLAAA